MTDTNVTELDPVFGCELWLGRRDKRDGRALTFRGGKPFAAYLAVWQDEHGPLPDGHALDHACRRPWCVALHHLEPVTKRENELRKSMRWQANRKLCKNGHDLELLGVRTPEGGKVCRACNRAASGAQA